MEYEIKSENSQDYAQYLNEIVRSWIRLQYFFYLLNVEIQYGTYFSVQKNWTHPKTITYNKKGGLK